MKRILAGLARYGMLASLLGLGSIAPLQCKHDPDPTLRREDTAGDALWELSEKFRAEHNDAAAKDTLRFLVERYPSNRHAFAAREELAKTAAPDGGA